MMLYAHTDGRLEIGAQTPAEALPIISAEQDLLVDAVAVLADDSPDGTWRVPGLRAGVEGLERLNALEHFCGRIRFHLAGRQQQ